MNAAPSATALGVVAIHANTAVIIAVALAWLSAIHLPNAFRKSVLAIASVNIFKLSELLNRYKPIIIIIMK